MKINKYVKKPVEIEAVLVELEWFPNIESWCGGKISEYYDKMNNLVKCIEIHTLEGTMTAQIGDYIIKGVKGEFYPCKDDVFKYSYALVN